LDPLVEMEMMVYPEPLEYKGLPDLRDHPE
jgi:hypothetical protein